jgi:hypothetical protein
MSQPIILIKRVRDRKAWLRELVGLFSDALDWLESVGEKFVRELGK